MGVDRQGAVAVVELRRGKVNAIDVELLDELGATFESPRATTTTSVPSCSPVPGRVFSAGVDLRRVVDADPAYVERLVAGLRGALEAFFCFPKPTVAAVNGAAVAGGCIVACACDRRLMADTARIGASELAVGVPFPVAALEILHHACGSRTEDVVFSARLFDADGGGGRSASCTRCARSTTCSSAPWRSAPSSRPGPPWRSASPRPSCGRRCSNGCARDAGIDGRTTAIAEWGASHTAQRLADQLDRCRGTGDCASATPSVRSSSGPTARRRAGDGAGASEPVVGLEPTT